MNRDDIIRMAKDAGFEADGFGIGIWDSAEFNYFAAIVAAEKEQQMIRDGWRYAKELEQSINALMKENARLVPKSLVDACIQEEREACAKVCEETRFPDSYTAIRCAAAIRARG